MDQLVGQPGLQPRRFGRVSFDRSVPGLTGIAVKGFLLGIITFGIYRFWYMTNLRRFFWSRTYVAGSPAEYTGRGRELFLGFLVALAILVPVYVGLFLLSVYVPDLAPYTAPISFVFLFLLGQYALFRGRRYRASRTLWRGIRLGQEGSAFVYVAKATGWWVATILSLGIAFPWMRASLERYRINHTLVGEGRMHSTATGASIAVPWLVFYAVGLLPILLAGLGFFAAAGFSVPLDLFVTDPNNETETIFNPVYKDTPLFAFGIGIIVVAFISLPLTVLLIPYYRARETRAFLRAAHLGSAQLTSTLKARQFYLPYLVYFAATTAVGVVVGIVIAAATALIQLFGVGDAALIPLLVATVPIYLGGLLVFSVLYLRLVTSWLWHAVATSTGISGVETLDSLVASARRPGSGLNEGLADALDVGGAIEIGF